MLIQNPVTRLTVAHVELSNGTKFSIVHNLDDAVWTSHFNRWLRKTKRLTAISLIYFIKERKNCIICTKEQYDEVAEGKVVHATKEEYEAENN